MECEKEVTGNVKNEWPFGLETTFHKSFGVMTKRKDDPSKIRYDS